MLPNPKQTTRSTIERNWRCPKYKFCMNLAFEKNWKGWRCNKCGYKNETREIEYDQCVYDYSPYVINLPKGNNGSE